MNKESNLIPNCKIPTICQLIAQALSAESADLKKNN